MTHDGQTWLNDLPQCFRDYRGGQRLEEVESIIPDMVGMSRGKSMPFYKFTPDKTFFLPTSLFYQTITGEYVDVPGIESHWAEVDMVLKPDMSTASAALWANDMTLQVICDLQTRDGAPIGFAPRNVLRRVLAQYAERGWQPLMAP